MRSTTRSPRSRGRGWSRAIGLNLLSVVAARGRVGHGDQAVASIRRRRAFRSSSRRSASACSRTPCCPAASASSRASPCCAGACPAGKGTTATLIGSVFAHRMFDLFPTIALVIWVLFTAKIPGWASHARSPSCSRRRSCCSSSRSSLARRQHRELEALGRIPQLIARARQGSRSCVAAPAR